nr:photosystem II cytochrome b559 beta subunit [Cymbidium wenshanense]
MTIDQTYPIFIVQWLVVTGCTYYFIFRVNISNAVHPTISLIQFIEL